MSEGDQRFKFSELPLGASIGPAQNALEWVAEHNSLRFDTLSQAERERVNDEMLNDQIVAVLFQAKTLAGVSPQIESVLDGLVAVRYSEIAARLEQPKI